MAKRISLFLDFGNVFISIFLNISNIEVEKNSNINESENFNIDIQTYLTPKRKYEEFIVIKVNFNTIKNNNKEHLYNKNDFYFEFNNVKHNNII